MAKRVRKKGFGKTDQFFSKISKLENKGKRSIKTVVKTNLEVGSLADLDSLKQKIPGIIKKASKKTLNIVVKELKEALNAAMEAKVWQWDYGDGDIIDTGALKKSLKIVAASDGDIYIFYNEEYAAIVHYGGYIHPYGNPEIKVYMPARPWISSVLEGGGPVSRYDFEGVYQRIFVPEIQKLLSAAGMS